MKSNREFVVACLCAEWCDSCREYRPGFLALAGRFPQAQFRWIDIEDEADRVGDIDVVNFPTLLVACGDVVLFFGTMRPIHEHLARLLEEFCAQTPEQSRAYAAATDERRAWQANADLRSVLRARS